MADVKERITKIVGLGADGTDGHIRFTQGGHYEVVQGSEHSHELMQQWCEAIQQRLDAMNKDMKQLSVEEFLALAKDAAPRS